MLTDSQKKQIAQALGKLLADTYTLYLKTLNFHWNVTGPMFSSLHLMFEAQYIDLAAANDEIAERIRALGEYAPASYSQFAKLTKIKESTDVPHWQEMVKQLAEDQKTVDQTADDVFKIANEHGDQPTVDLVTRRMEVHEKAAWMLGSILEK